VKSAALVPPFVRGYFGELLRTVAVGSGTAIGVVAGMVSIETARQKLPPGLPPNGSKWAGIRRDVVSE